MFESWLKETKLGFILITDSQMSFHEILPNLPEINPINMKRLAILVFVFAILCFKGNGQEISYGSNQGKHISLSGTKIYYEEYGSGVPLLLLHGGFGSIHDFQEVIPELADHFRVIAIDSPGHGRSEQADSLSFELMSSYCSELIDAFKLDSVYIIGYSDGGITALLLAEKRPDKIKKLSHRVQIVE